MMTVHPKVIDRKVVFKGSLISVRIDELSTGQSREVVVHPGAAAVAALDDSGRLVLVRQYRHAQARDLWEIPAGLLEPGEDPLASARRELLEETGMKARSWRHLSSFFSSPGCLTEIIHVFGATRLEPDQGSPDPEEVSAVDFVPLPVVLSMVADGRIQDAKTIIAALLLGRASTPRRP